MIRSSAYARSVERDGLVELSEFFVRPERQSAGLGQRLLELTLPPGRGEVRAIIATMDVRALARYYRAGTVARFPIASLSASPQATDPGDLQVVRATREDVSEISAIEETVLRYPRHADYAWLFSHREAYLYRRAGRSIGFAFGSDDGQGPIAALKPTDQPSILLHLEGRAHDRGTAVVSFEIPMINEIAMRHLLERRFRIEPPLTVFMSSVPFGNFDRFVLFGPPIVL